MLVTLEDFNTYSGNLEAESDIVHLKEDFLRSAEEIVGEYLGYAPALTNYSEVYLSSYKRPALYLPAKNVISVDAITINGREQDMEQFIIKDDHIRFKDGRMFPRGEDNIIVTFSAGWEPDTVPTVIKMSILRIATLMLQETNGNIGLSGKSYADQSRTFISYTNYAKYLSPIDGYRIPRI